MKVTLISYYPFVQFLNFVAVGEVCGLCFFCENSICALCQDGFKVIVRVGAITAAPPRTQSELGVGTGCYTFCPHLPVL